MCVGVSQQHFHKSTILTANRKRNREIQSSSVLIRRQLDKCGTQQIAIISLQSRVPYRWIPLIYTAATLALYTPFVTIFKRFSSVHFGKAVIVEEERSREPQLLFSVWVVWQASSWTTHEIWLADAFNCMSRELFPLCSALRPSTNRNRSINVMKVQNFSFCFVKLC